MVDESFKYFTTSGFQTHIFHATILFLQTLKTETPNFSELNVILIYFLLISAY